jgi:cysteine synthase A
VSTPAPPPAPVASAPPAIEADADAFVQQVIGDREQPVVMFALEWCEFCWSVRRLFGKYKIPYRSIDLDSVEYQQGDRGGKIRAALTARTNVATIPQIFVGGELLGGATDVLPGSESGTAPAAARREPRLVRRARRRRATLVPAGLAAAALGGAAQRTSNSRSPAGCPLSATCTL